MIPIKWLDDIRHGMEGAAVHRYNVAIWATLCSEGAQSIGGCTNVDILHASMGIVWGYTIQMSTCLWALTPMSDSRQALVSNSPGSSSVITQTGRPANTHCLLWNTDGHCQRGVSLPPTCL